MDEIYELTLGTTASSSADQLQAMRPTLVIGAGGTGQQILTTLKAILQRRFGDAWRDKIRLLAFDTAEESFIVQTNGSQGAQTIQLEPNAEFINIGNVPIPNIARNIDNLTAIKERMGPLMAQLPPTVLRSGAKQLRPLGLVALLWHFPTIREEMERAIWHLAGREQVEAVRASQQQGVNVFICGSLVGGTGSGAFLDLAHLVRAYFTDLGTQAEFCHITGIGVLPQAFQGVRGPNLEPNTAAALEELNYLMVQGGLQTRYPGGLQIDSREAPYNLFHLIDGVDERGQTWSGLQAVTAMTAQGIFLQMGSQLGRKGENAFDNMDEVLIGQTEDGYGTFCCSFGLGNLDFDAPAVVALCTRWFLQDLIDTGWLQPAPEEETLAGPLLSREQLTPRLGYDPETEATIQVDLPLPGWLARKSAGDVAAEATRYVREYGQARINEQILPQIEANGVQLAAEEIERWQNWATEHFLDPQFGLRHCRQTIDQTQQQVNDWRRTIRRGERELAAQLERLDQAVIQYEGGVSQAATSFPLGRGGRIRAALEQYIQAAERWYTAQVEQQLLRTEQQVWQKIATTLDEFHAHAIRLDNRLSHIARALQEATPRQLDRVTAGGVARLSLTDADYTRELYQRFRPSWTDVATQVGNPLSLCHLTEQELQQTLVERLTPNFAAIRQMTVEDVLHEQAERDGPSPRARRQQLFRLATPSWNVDRARLPDGGASLVRLEVLGVPDEQNTLFADEPMLVATGDPYRLTALVVVAGAPQTALQQYDRYRQAMAETRNPLHVLPAFMTGDDEAHLAFALGSIFGLIYSQGTFFYYRPADELESALKLGNGLNNAIEVFSDQDGLPQEVRERVEGEIARLGLRDAIAVLTDYYTAVPEGNTALDEQLRGLKRLVRDYTDSLRRIDAFSAGANGRS